MLDDFLIWLLCPHFLFEHGHRFEWARATLPFPLLSTRATLPNDITVGAAFFRRPASDQDSV